MNKKTTFRVDPLGAVQADTKTQEILSQVEHKSEFIRNAIMKYATGLGFEVNNSFSHCPSYMDHDIWAKAKTLQDKRKSVDYSFVIAFYWLKSLDKFRYIQHGTLLREIIHASI